MPQTEKRVAFDATQPCDIPGLKTRVNFRRLVEETHEINREGKVICPYHDEATPSCHVYEDGFKCFGCGKRGDYVDWLEGVHGLSKPEAIQELKHHAGMVEYAPKVPPKAKEHKVYKSVDDGRLESHQRDAANLTSLPVALQGRGFTVEDAKTLNMAADGEDLLFANPGPDGTVLNIKRRKAKPIGKSDRYAGLPGHGTPAWCSPGFIDQETVLIMEGELNGMACWLALPDLAVMGVAGVNGDLYPDALKGKKVFIYADGDEAGKKARDRWADEALVALAASVNVIEPFHKDACDIAGNDGREALATRLNEALAASQRYVSRPLEEEPWQDMKDLPDLYPLVPSLLAEMLPEPLRPWLQDIAERTCLPLEFVACPTLVALGAVVGRSVGIHPKQHDDWLVVPNLFGGIVGRPGVMKSTAIAEATKPLTRLAAEAQKTHEQAKFKAEAKSERLKLEIATLKEDAKRAKKGGKACDLTNFEEQLQKLLAELAEAKVTERRYMTQDPTTEKLGELCQENPRGMLISRDELAGWLRTLERTGREGDREFYLEGWNGTGAYTFDRIGRGTVHIRALTLSILGGIQPGKLQKYLEEALEGGGGADGLLQRFQLTVWPDHAGEWRNVDRGADTAAKNRAYRVFEALDKLDVADLNLDASEDAIPALRFSSEAQALFDTWRDELEHRLRSGELDHMPAFESHLSKYRSLMPSLALLFHLVDVVDGKASGPVSLEAAKLAADWCDYLEMHAKKLYAPEISAHIKAARDLAGKIEEGAIKDGQTVRDIYRNDWQGLKDRDTVMAGLEVLAQHNWIRTQEKSAGGRPSLVIRLHPSLREAR